MEVASVPRWLKPAIPPNVGNSGVLVVGDCVRAGPQQSCQYSIISCLNLMGNNARSIKFTLKFGHYQYNFIFTLFLRRRNQGGAPGAHAPPLEINTLKVHPPLEKIL